MKLHQRAKSTVAKFAVAVAAGIGAVALTGPVSAQSYPASVENKCSDDYLRFCSAYEVGSTKLKRCMEANGRNLSRGCQQALKDAGLAGSSRSSRKYSSR
ncbi:MAG: hypothetical protein JSS20_18150 [Proteobacteria bacterium]|nr:hypothetical protein [Pseudomonadota bacterium]